MDKHDTTPSSLQRLDQQIRFTLEIDNLKHVIRRCYLVNGERRENTAEHSWHLAVGAVVLAEHVDEEVDLLRVLKMALIHDIVEIDAGDTFAYDAKGYEDKAEREQLAAERLFGLLPENQASEFRQLWHEFEAIETPEARFATALDRLMPMLHNYHTEGRAWREHGVTSEQVLGRMKDIRPASESLWQFVQALVQDAVDKGFLAA